jgi:hypothetical protein
VKTIQDAAATMKTARECVDPATISKLTPQIASPSSLRCESKRLDRSVATCHPTSRGFVRLRSADGADKPVIQAERLILLMNLVSFCQKPAKSITDYNSGASIAYEA